MTEGQSSASREGRSASVTMLAAREARSRRAATVCRPCLRRWTRSTDAGVAPPPERIACGLIQARRREAARRMGGNPPRTSDAVMPRTTSLRRANCAFGECRPLAGAPPFPRKSARGSPSDRGARRTGFPRAPEKLIAHNPAHLRTIPHYFAHNRGARGRWPSRCGGGVRGGHRRRGRKGKTAAQRGGRATAARVRPQREAVSMRPLKRRNGVSERGPWSAPRGRADVRTRDGRTTGSERLAEARSARKSESDYPCRYPASPASSSDASEVRSRRHMARIATRNRLWIAIRPPDSFSRGRNLLRPGVFSTFMLADRAIPAWPRRIAMTVTTVRLRHTHLCAPAQGGRHRRRPGRSDARRDYGKHGRQGQYRASSTNRQRCSTTSPRARFTDAARRATSSASGRAVRPRNRGKDQGVCTYSFATTTSTRPSARSRRRCSARGSSGK